MVLTMRTHVIALWFALLFLVTQPDAIIAELDQMILPRSDGASTSTHSVQKTITVVPVPAATPGKTSHPASISSRSSTQSGQQVMPIPGNAFTPEKSTPASSKSNPTVGVISITRSGSQTVATTLVAVAPGKPSSHSGQPTLSASISGQKTTASKSSKPIHPSPSTSQKSSTLPIGAPVPAPTHTSGLIPPKASGPPSGKSSAAPAPAQAPLTGSPTLGGSTSSTTDAPHGVGGIIMPGLMTLPSPSLGDSWKGTTIPGMLSVPSPTLRWDKSLFTSDKTSGGAEGASLLSGLLGLAKQAENAVKKAADALNSLKCQRSLDSCPISFPDRSNAVAALASATQDVGGYGAGVDAALGDSIEMTERFPPAARAPLFEIQKQNRNLFTQLKDLSSDISQCITKPAVCFEVVTKHKQAFAIGGSVLSLLAQQGVTSIAALPKPIHPPLANNSTEKKKKPDNQFFIVTVEGTSMKAYQKFIQSLPDGGSGQQRHYDWPRTYQTYLARMTEKEAQDVNGNSIVDMIGANRIKINRNTYQVQANERGFGQFHSKSQEIGTRLDVRDEDSTLVLERRNNSDLHLRMLSLFPFSELRDLQHTMDDTQDDYRHEQSLGKGTRIYILEEGFKLHHKEFDRGDHLKPETYVFDDEPLSNGDYEDYFHGDSVAAFAVGKSIGVASQAGFTAVKLFRNLTISSEGRIDEHYDSWHWVLSDVRAKRLEGKAVINYSSGKTSYRLTQY
ncbi:MAG: hypothetical protein Q9224_002413 [Gallowayella concinna]